MKKLSIPIKLVLTLTCGMIAVTMLSFQWFPAELMPGLETPTPQVTPSPSPSPQPSPTATIIEPFVNLSDLLVVEIEFHPDAQPQVLSVLPINEGRITPGGIGDTQLKVIDRGGKTVYESSFNPIFVYGEPAKKHDSIQMIFIIPNAGSGSLIQITSADWTMEYKIDGN